MTGRRALLLYDGRCGLCLSLVARLRRLDRDGLLEVKDLHDPQVPLLHPEIDPRRASERMQLIRPEGGAPLEGYDAARWIAERLPGPRRWAFLGKLPGASWIGRRIYDRVARRRRTAGACPLHGSAPE